MHRWTFALEQYDSYERNAGQLAVQTDGSLTVIHFQIVISAVLSYT